LSFSPADKGEHFHSSLEADRLIVADIGRLAWPQAGSAMITIAVVADTHGLLRPEIPNAIKDVDHIIHAGDLGKMEILDKLNGIAPTSIRPG